MSIDPLLLAIFLIPLIALLSLYLLVGIIFLKTYFKLKPTWGDGKKDYLHFLQGLFFILFFAGRLVLAIFDVINESSGENVTPETLLLWKAGILIFMMGYGVFFFVMEMRILKGKDKYIPFILYCIILLIGLIIPDIPITSNCIMAATALSLYIPIAYFYIAIVSNGTVRKKALLVFIGIMVMYVATAMISEPFINIFKPIFENFQIHSISYSIMSIGVILIYTGLRREN